MSMQPRPWPEVPEETARVAKSAFRRGGSLAIRIRDELGSWYEDGDFAAAYPVRGKPGISPAQLAMVTVLQFCEDLTDRQAADEVRGRVDWKYCLGLELADEGFDASVLTGFRERLVEGGAERVIFDRLLDLLRQRGLAKAGGRQRTDSTHVLARIRDLNRLELAGETVRAALEALAAAAPGWLAGVTGASWQRVYGQRTGDLRLPDGDTARRELAVQYGKDGYYLLEQVHGPAAPGWLAELPAVQALRRIWVQQYYREAGQDGEKVIRREEREHGLPPGRDHIISPYDLDARYSEKHGMSWLGYKGHFTETVSDPADDDPGTGRPAVPNLVTDVQTTHAAVPDVVMTAPVHDSLEACGAAPRRARGRFRVRLRRPAGVLAAAGPHPARPAAGRRLRPGPLRRVHRGHVRHRLGPPPGHLPAGRRQQQMGAAAPARRQGSHQRPVRYRDLPGLPGPGQMHHGEMDRPAAVPAPPGDPRGRRRRPRRAGHPALERPVQDPRRRGGPHAPGHLRHRHPPRPLHRPGQDPPGAPRRRHRHQRDPARRLVQRQAPGQDPDHPPSAHQPRAGDVSPN
jgi:transposase